LYAPNPPGYYDRTRALGDLRVETHTREIPNGYAGTAAIIAEMKRVTLGALFDERVNQLARSIVADVGVRDHFAEAASCLAYMQANFRWNRLPEHPDGLQRLQTPIYTLFEASTRNGECASLSCALAALLMSLGHKVAFRTVSSRDDENAYEHVLVFDLTTQQALDPSYDFEPGQEHPATVKKEDWPLS
jgi:hypothetical protein